jgi:hypothetical protein
VKKVKRRYLPDIPHAELPHQKRLSKKLLKRDKELGEKSRHI